MFDYFQMYLSSTSSNDKCFVSVRPIPNGDPTAPNPTEPDAHIGTDLNGAKRVQSKC